MSAETNNQVILDQQMPTVGDSNDQPQPPSESQANLDAPMTTVAASDAGAPDQDNSEQDPLQESAKKTVQSIQSNQE
jgi:hypothetical protein